MNKTSIYMLILSLTCTAAPVFLPPISAQETDPDVLTQSSVQEAGTFSCFTIAAATDLHYISPQLTDNGPAFTQVAEKGDGKAVLWCEEITDAFTEEIILLHPDALVLTGDLTFNGEYQSHRDLALKLEHIEEQDIPVYVIPGNHDLNYPYAASYEGDRITLTRQTTPEEFAEIYADFGYKEAFSRDPASLSYAVEPVPDGGLWVLMIDVNMPDSPGALKDETLQWAEGILQSARDAGVSVITASHQNLLSQNDLFSYGYQMEHADALLEIIENSPVLCNLSGHTHIPHYAFSENGLPDIAGGAMITAPDYYGVLTALLPGPMPPGSGEENDMQTVSCSYEARELEFPHREDVLLFLQNNIIRQNSSKTLPGNVLDYIIDFSRNIIAGRADQIVWDEEIYLKICEEDPILGYYMLTVQKEGLKDYTRLDWSYASRSGRAM